jgi:hypothetical protein
MTLIAILLEASLLLAAAVLMQALVGKRLSATSRHLLWTLAIVGLLDQTVGLVRASGGRRLTSVPAAPSQPPRELICPHRRARCAAFGATATN